MDSVPSYEFHKIFDRVSMDIDLKGATSAAAIENRLRLARHYAKKRAKAAKRRVAKEYYGFKAEELDKLIEHDFADRAIFFANINRKGIIAQTLIHGREEALKRVKAQKLAATRAVIERETEKEAIERVARELARREKLRPRWLRYGL